jgi:hypothetical protein
MRKLPLTADEDLLEIVMRRYEPCRSTSSCQMDMALRPCDRPVSMTSRYGSLVLAVGIGDDFCPPEPVVTSLPLAGFAASGPVVTSLAGFETVIGAFRRPQPPGEPTGIPAAFKYPAAVSRRTPVASSIRRSAQPSWPSAMTCFYLFFAQDIHVDGGYSSRLSNVLTAFSLAGFQVTTIGRFWVTAEAPAPPPKDSVSRHRIRTVLKPDR